MTKNIRKLIVKKNDAQDMSNEVSNYFKMNNWYFDSKEFLRTLDLLSPEELKEFPFDTRKVNWDIAGQIFTYGTVKYYLGINVISPDSDLKQCVQLNNIEFGHDLKFISNTYEGMAGKSLQDVFEAVLEPSQY